MPEDYIVIKNNQPKSQLSRRNLLFIISSIVIAILVIILIVVINLDGRPSQPDIVKVTDYSSLDVEVPTIVQEDLSAQLYYVLNQHFDLPDNSSAINAVIRPDTAQSTYVDNFAAVSFLLDIGEYQQTYKISLSWPLDGSEPIEDVMINCTPRTLSNYPDATCYSMYNTSDSVELYLPYSGTTTGLDFTVDFSYYNSKNNPVLVISVSDCGDQSAKDAALAAAKSYIDSLSIDPGEIIYEIPSNYNNCVIR